MDKPISTLTIVGTGLFFVAGFILLPLLPWAEIGLNVGEALKPVTIGPFSLDLKPLNGLYETVFSALPERLKNLKDDPNYPFYIYSFFLGIAMTCAAIGLALVGREEAEEKTVLPAKK